MRKKGGHVGVKGWDENRFAGGFPRGLVHRIFALETTTARPVYMIEKYTFIYLIFSRIYFKSRLVFRFILCIFAPQFFTTIYEQTTG